MMIACSVQVLQCYIDVPHRKVGQKKAISVCLITTVTNGIFFSYIYLLSDSELRVCIRRKYRMKFTGVLWILPTRMIFLKVHTNYAVIIFLIRNCEQRGLGAYKVTYSLVLTLPSVAITPNISPYNGPDISTGMCGGGRRGKMMKHDDGRMGLVMVLQPPRSATGKVI